MASSKKREATPKVTASTKVISGQDATNETSKGIPFYDPKELLEQMKKAVANGDSDPRPEQFCFISGDGEIVKVTTATGATEVIGHINNISSEKATSDEDVPVAAIEIVRQRLIDEAEVHGKNLSMRRLIEMAPAKIVEFMADRTETSIRDLANLTIYGQMDDNPRINMDWVLRCMPNGVMFDCQTGIAVNPDYIIMTADYSLYAIIGHAVMAVILDNGIVRCDRESTMYPFESGMSITDKINYWNYSMALEEKDLGSIILGYVKVPKSIKTRYETKVQTRAAFRGFQKAIGTALSGVSEIFGSAANSVMFSLSDMPDYTDYLDEED